MLRITETPHQRGSTTWECADWEEFISRVKAGIAQNGEVGTREEFNRKELIEYCGPEPDAFDFDVPEEDVHEDDEIREAFSICKKHGSVFYYIDGVEEGRWLSPADTPSEKQWAIDWNSHDLQSCEIEEVEEVEF